MFALQLTEAAAEDGLELNRMVSELLRNQTGSDSIISSVEDLQQQLNEQQGISLSALRVI
jgi:transport and golgi organization protein 1